VSILVKREMGVRLGRRGIDTENNEDVVG